MHQKSRRGAPARHPLPGAPNGSAARRKARAGAEAAEGGATEKEGAGVTCGGVTAHEQTDRDIRAACERAARRKRLSVAPSRKHLVQRGEASRQSSRQGAPTPTLSAVLSGFSSGGGNGRDRHGGGGARLGRRVPGAEEEEEEEEGLTEEEGGWPASTGRKQ